MNVKEKFLSEIKKPKFWNDILINSLLQIIFFLVGFISGMIGFLLIIKTIFGQ